MLCSTSTFSNAKTKWLGWMQSYDNVLCDVYSVFTLQLYGSSVFCSS